MSSKNLTTLLFSTFLALVAASAAAAAPTAMPLPGKAFMTVDEALSLAFPDCEIERTTAYLDAAAKERVAELAQQKFDSGVVFPYVARREGVLVGTAYFDSHRVRTLRETLMVVVSPKGRIERIEILGFGEPLDYVPRQSWYAQFEQRKLDPELQLKRAIHPVAGATLTARATTNAARRVLALHQVLTPPAEKRGQGSGTTR